MRLIQPLKKKRVSTTEGGGFTLIEVMICLSVLIIVSTLMPIMFMNLYAAKEQLDSSVHEEWDLFVIQFRNEIKLHHIQQTDLERLTLVSEEGKLIVFSKYGSLLRRQVNGSGHEVYLTSVDRVRFTHENQLLLLEVVFKDGSAKEAQFIDAS